MKQCNDCDRHLFGEEPACPFCGAEQRTTFAGGDGPRMTGPLALAFALVVVACGPGIAADATSANASEDTGPPASTTMATTTNATPSNPGTTEGPSTTTIADSSSDDDSADDAPCGFYAGCPSDAGSRFECDLFAQDCEEGEKCMPWANDGGNVWNATRCSPVANNPGQEDEPCLVEGTAVSGFDDCDVGLMCSYVDAKTNEGTCISLCGNSAVDPTCPSETQVCTIASDSILSLCTDTCNPLTPNCIEGSNCYPLGENFICAPSTSVGLYGDACMFLHDCAAGHACISDTAFLDCATPGCCTEYCDLSAPEACPETELGVTCQPWYSPAPPGFEDVGVCSAL